MPFGILFIVEVTRSYDIRENCYVGHQAVKVILACCRYTKRPIVAGRWGVEPLCLFGREVTLTYGTYILNPC